MKIVKKEPEPTIYVFEEDWGEDMIGICLETHGRGDTVYLNAKEARKLVSSLEDLLEKVELGITRTKV